MVSGEVLEAKATEESQEEKAPETKAADVVPAPKVDTQGFAVSPKTEQFQTTAKKLEEAKKALAKKQGPYHVVAVRTGFYDGKRRQEGDKFTIESVEALGSWMKPI